MNKKIMLSILTINIVLVGSNKKQITHAANTSSASQRHNMDSNSTNSESQLKKTILTTLISNQKQKDDKWLPDDVMKMIINNIILKFLSTYNDVGPKDINVALNFYEQHPEFKDEKFESVLLQNMLKNHTEINIKLIEYFKIYPELYKKLILNYLEQHSYSLTPNTLELINKYLDDNNLTRTLSAKLNTQNKLNLFQLLILNPNLKYLNSEDETNDYYIDAHVMVLNNSRHFLKTLLKSLKYHNINVKDPQTTLQILLNYSSIPYDIIYQFATEMNLDNRIENIFKQVLLKILRVHPAIFIAILKNFKEAHPNINLTEIEIPFHRFNNSDIVFHGGNYNEFLQTIKKVNNLPECSNQLFNEEQIEEVAKYIENPIEENYEKLE